MRPPRVLAPIAAVIAAAALLLPGCVATQFLAWDAESRFPDVGGHVALDERRIRFLEAGEGRPIVLVHGAFGGCEDFGATILGDVAKLGRAIAFDRPGHGWSTAGCGDETPWGQARTLRDAARAIGAERPLVVGFSYGGAVAAAWAAQFPDEVAGLVLLNAPTHPWGGEHEIAETLGGSDVFGGVVNWNLLVPIAHHVAPQRAVNAFLPDPVPDSFAASPLLLALRPEPFRKNAREIRDLDEHLAAQAASYGSVRCPVEFVVGELDRVVGPTHHSLRFLSEVPSTVRTALPATGHQLLFLRPGACGEAIERALRRRSER